MATLAVFSAPQPTQAQSITLDGTLGPARALTGPTYDIQQSDGTVRSNNLFHSFGRFNLNTGEQANFFSAATIQNIFARVTGGLRSEIDGLIFTQSANVNLYLMNPSGILFGPNARLDVGGVNRGSFVATTANAIQFGDRGFFSANPATQPPPLLTINPSAFVFNQLNQGEILNRSTTPLGRATPTGFDLFGLQVPAGQSIALVGGPIQLEGGGIHAPGGRVEFASLAAPGSVGLEMQADGLRLQMPAAVARGDVSLTNNALVNVAAGGGGAITIYARNLDLQSGGWLRGGIEAETTATRPGGDITVDATETIRLSGFESDIINNVRVDSTGDTGSIVLNAGALSLTDQATLQSIIRGNGNSGDIVINARDSVEFDDARLFMGTSTSGTGNGGIAEINTGSLTLLNGARFDVSSGGQGQAGSIVINARDRVQIDGTPSASGNSSFMAANLGTGAIGRGGTIQINTDSLRLTNGAQLTASTEGQGDGGSITVNARDITFQGFLPRSDGTRFRSGIFNGVDQGGNGNGGDIRITTDSLSILEGAAITGFTRGTGNASNIFITARDRVAIGGAASSPEISSSIDSSVEATGIGRGGNIQVNTNSLRLTNGAQLSTSTSGQGDSGSIAVNARDITFQGFLQRSDGVVRSGIFNGVDQGGNGNGGDIRITTDALSILEGGAITGFTRGTGNASNIFITARDRVAIDGAASSPEIVSGINSSVEVGGIGRGGNIQITTGSLSLTDGAQLVTAVSGQGDGGNVTLTARDITFQGFLPLSNGKNFRSGVSAIVQQGGIGNGGDVRVTTDTLSILDGGGISTITRGTGNAGKIVITAADRIDLINSITAIDSSVQGGVGKGGTIQIQTPALSLANGSGISSNANGQGNAGDIIIDTDFLKIERRPGAISVLPSNGNISANTTAEGNAGNITITIRDAIDLDNGLIGSGVLDGGTAQPSQRGRGQGGNLRVTTGSLQMRNRSQLSTGSSGQGNAGNIVISARDQVVVEGGSAIESGLLSSNGSPAIGQAGDIQIDARSLFITNRGFITTLTSGQGNAGNITVQVGDRLSVDNGGFIASLTDGQGNAGNITVQVGDRFSVDNALIASGVDRNGQGNGGNIRINTGSLALTNGGQLNAATDGNGNAGNIDITAKDSISIDSTNSTTTQNSGIYVLSSTSGSTGNITITAPRLTIRDKGVISANSNSVNGGNITLNLRDYLLLRRGGSISTNAGTAQAGGNGGNITISAPRGFIVGVKRENSDITANAFTGNGGRVQIRAQGIYGLQFRPQLTEFSDITASSTFGLSGAVAINTLGIDPNRGLVALPVNLTDPSQQIAQECMPPSGKTASSFVITGRGGIPFGPEEMVQIQPLLPPWVQLPEEWGKGSEGVKEKVSEGVKGSEGERVGIVEAQGWIVDEKGIVHLVADAPNGGLPEPWLPMLDCGGRIKN